MKRRRFFKCLAGIFGAAVLAPFEKLSAKPTGWFKSEFKYAKNPVNPNQEVTVFHTKCLPPPIPQFKVFSLGEDPPEKENLTWIRLNQDGSYDNSYNFDKEKNCWVSAPNIYTGSRTVLPKAGPFSWIIDKGVIMGDSSFNSMPDKWVQYRGFFPPKSSS
jgi:hypothetical protein